ncbi:MAG: hypothetical protein AABX39_06445 [Nanoarchaeota archaeon]
MSEVIDAQIVYGELKFIRENMVSKEELNSMVETLEILHNSDTIKQIVESMKDIKAGRTKRVRSVKDLLAD